jgi:hypothetical protein
VVVVVLALLMELPRMTGVPAAVLLTMKARGGPGGLVSLERTARHRILVMMAVQEVIMRWVPVGEVPDSQENGTEGKITGAGMAEME